MGWRLLCRRADNYSWYNVAASVNILIVEPNRLLADVYVRHLQAAGHAARAVRSAQDAVHAADEQMPDVVIVELQLPKHNGVEFLYEFRSYSEWLHIPIIIHSFVPPQEYSNCEMLKRELGVVESLYKPNTSLHQLGMAVLRHAPALTA